MLIWLATLNVGNVIASYLHDGEIQAFRYLINNKPSIMKKAFTFLVAAMLGIVVTASAQNNEVILTNNSNYEVNIDSRVYNANNTYNINDLNTGNHLVSVYRVSSGGIFTRKTRNLIASKQFSSGNGTVRISVNQSGQISINRSQNGSGNNDGTWNDNGDKKYGKSEGKGNGHKYGHYKDKKNKSQKSDRKDREDDDDKDKKYDKNKKSGRGNGKS